MNQQEILYYAREYGREDELAEYLEALKSQKTATSGKILRRADVVDHSNNGGMRRALHEDRLEDHRNLWRKEVNHQTGIISFR